MVGAGHVAEAHDAVRRVSGPDGGGERLHAPAVGPRDHEAHVGVVGGQAVEGAHESWKALAGLDGADGEHVAVAAGEGPTARGLPGSGSWRCRSRRARRRRRGARKCARGSRRARGHSRCGRPRRRCERPVHLRFEVHGLGPAQVEVMDEREVVHRHDDRRGGGGRDEVGRVDDVDRAGPVLDPRPFGAGPRRVHDAGGGSRRRRMHTGREHTQQVAARGAADCVARDRDVRARRRAPRPGGR